MIKRLIAVAAGTVMVTQALVLPSSATSSASLAAPRAASAVTRPGAESLPTVPPWPKGKRFRQLGVDIFWSMEHRYSTPAEVLAESDAIVKDAVGYLHANYITVAFPVFESSLTGDQVHATALTPSVSDIRTLVTVAQSVGLKVVLRPLLEIGRSGWSGLVWPSDRDRFLSSYFYTIRPYLELAQQMKMPEFIYASEWIRLTSSKSYTSWFAYFVALMHRYYSGPLIYDDSGYQYLANNDVTPDRDAAGYHTDAYFPVPEADNTKTAELEYWWYLYLVHLGADIRSLTVLQEVGFDAQPGGYRSPSARLSPPTSTYFLWMQGDWISMVCSIFQHFNMAGLYFWRLNFNVDPAETSGDSPALSGNDWVSRTGASHISDCYESFYR